MTTADYEKTKGRIRTIVDKWESPLGLGWFRNFRVKYDNQYDRDSRETAAKCMVKWQYCDALITFFLPACVDEPDDELEYYFLHEAMHALVNEMREYESESGDDAVRCKLAHEDRVCTALAQRFLWTRDFARDGHWSKKPKKRKRR